MTASRILAATAALLTALAAASASAKVFQYTATLATAVASPTTVRAGVFNWKCDGTTCTINGPWAEPSVGQCKALAKEVGKVTAFGYPEAALDDAGLAECNGAAPAASQE